MGFRNILLIIFIMNLTKLMKVTVEYGKFLALSVLRILKVYFPEVVTYDWIPVVKIRLVRAWALENQQTLCSLYSNTQNCYIINLV